MHLQKEVRKDNFVVRHLKKDIEDFNQFIDNVIENVTRAENKVPELNDTIRQVKEKYEEIDYTIKNNVTNSIDYIKYLIDNSKSILDHIALSMRFNSTSQLVLDVPKAAYDPSINNDISLVFTVDSDNSDQFLFFIGNGDSPDSNDYLAMEIVGGRLRFHYKLSSGQPQNVTIATPLKAKQAPIKGVIYPREYKVEVTRYDVIKCCFSFCIVWGKPDFINLIKKKDIFVIALTTNSILYFLISYFIITYPFDIFRNFANALLRVGEIKGNGKYDNSTVLVEQHSIHVPASILNLGAKSDFFVGGVPGGKRVASTINARTFDGTMEEIVFNNQTMGLWNWKVC